MSRSTPHEPALPNIGKRVLLGEISGAHGIRGEVVVRSHTADPGAIGKYGILESSDGRALPRLKVVRVTDRGFIARLDGISDRTAAEKLKGTELWIGRDRLPAAKPGEYYHADLVGLAAIAPDGAAIGTIIAVENFGAGDLLEIRRAGTNSTEYVPFTNACVPEVDIAAGHAVVIMPEPAEAEKEDCGEEDADEGIEPEKT